MPCGRGDHHRGRHRPAAPTKNSCNCLDGFQNSVEAIIVTDADERILSVNRAFTDVTGYTEAEAIGQTPRLLRSGHHDKGFYDPCGGTSTSWASGRAKSTTDARTAPSIPPPCRSAPFA